ncbi:MAG: UDP-N-acetylmuramoyl-L-alanyl-D-glutamate--2,6-diaminopimelate ligase [Fuerstiella sp.]|nr:UDP-N-acetylmuramoyl-L-alanyl-D-glutamate--2,6-diaminopimelate ligase [Fuerstiella sp.]
MNDTTLSLQQLLPEAQFVNCRDIAISRVSTDSRRIHRGDVFVAVTGNTYDGHGFIDEAIARGAVAIVVQRFISNSSIPQCIVNCTATAHALTSMALAVGQQQSTTVAGITGTNGKTTTSWMLRSILESAGHRTGLIGTICTSDGVDSTSSMLTTPSAGVLADHFRRMSLARTSHCALEISSHALVQKRCAGIHLSAAAITNVTQDHFDYHGTQDAYEAAKADITSLLYPEAPLLLNADDPGCQSIMKRLDRDTRIVTYGNDNPAAELRSTVLRKTHRSQRVRLSLAQGDAEFRLRLIGRHNVSNCLAAAGIAEQLGISLSHIVDGLQALHAVPGRVERIDEGQPFQVLVDYAHTPDALAQCLDAVRDFVPGRLICVFGAGGERDRSKRPLMAHAAMAADVAIVTSDNPRSEDPGQIITDITAGFSADAVYVSETDRQQAISVALEQAEPGDVVVVAGRGHERTQESAGAKLSFDDREVVRQLLRAADCSVVDNLQPRFSIQRSA